MKSGRAVAGLLAAAALAGCGTSRGVDSYCTTFYGEGQAFRQHFLDSDPQRDPIGTMGQLLAAPRDLAVFFGKLADVAPEDIEPDVETVRDAFQTQADGLDDKAGAIASGPAGLLGSLAGDVANGLATAPAMQRIDTWTTSHCGPPPTT